MEYGELELTEALVSLTADSPEVQNAVVSIIAFEEGKPDTGLSEDADEIKEVFREVYGIYFQEARVGAVLLGRQRRKEQEGSI